MGDSGRAVRHSGPAAIQAGRPAPTVHLLCGLNGAGKTTYARRLSRERGARLFCLDAWMIRRYPTLRYDTAEYGERAEGCKALIWERALPILAAGRDAILDWNGWSRARRAAWRDRAVAAGYGVTLHYLQVPLAVAIARAEARAEAGVADAHRLDAAAIRHLAAIFEEPTADEGMAIVTIAHRDA